MLFGAPFTFFKDLKFFFSFLRKFKVDRQTAFINPVWRLYQENEQPKTETVPRSVQSGCRQAQRHLERSVFQICVAYNEVIL